MNGNENSEMKNKYYMKVLPSKNKIKPVIITFKQLELKKYLGYESSKWKAYLSGKMTHSKINIVETEHWKKRVQNLTNRNVLYTIVTWALLNLSKLWENVTKTYRFDKSDLHLCIVH